MVVRLLLRWIGHAIRIPVNRISREILHGRLKEGDRSVGGQCKHNNNHVKATLKKKQCGSWTTAGVCCRPDGVPSAIMGSNSLKRIVVKPGISNEEDAMKETCNLWTTTSLCATSVEDRAKPRFVFRFNEDSTSQAVTFVKLVNVSFTMGITINFIFKRLFCLFVYTVEARGRSEHTEHIRT